MKLSVGFYVHSVFFFKLPTSICTFEQISQDCSAEPLIMIREGKPNGRGEEGKQLERNGKDER